MKKSCPLSKAYQFLEPGPVVLLTTARNGRMNVMTQSWHTMLEVIKAWIDPARKQPRTLHHRGCGAFVVAGRTIKLPSKMK